MRIFDDVVVYSPTDMVAAAECPFATLRLLDQKLGWVAPVDLPPNAMLERVARLGDDHEERVLAQLRDQFGRAESIWAGRGVVEIETADHSQSALMEAAAATVSALKAGADVVFQAAFLDGRFNGFADFLLKRPDPAGGWAYLVADTKLARRAKTSALIQIAAYADQLQRLGIPVARDGELILGDGAISEHDIQRIIPVYRERRAETQELFDQHQAGGQVVRWGDPQTRACGRCDTCQIEVAAHRDLLLVAGMRLTQRAKLNEAGIHTIDELAAVADASPDTGVANLPALRAQAQLQVIQDPPPPQSALNPAVAAPVDAAAGAAGIEVQETPDGKLAYQIFNEKPLRALPEPSEGDIFFDFEGDPLWQDPITGEWGLEYLFGVTEAPAGGGAEPEFRTFWAHDRKQEKVALRDFLDYVADRRKQWPQMHIYHYASYEKTALLRLAAKHATGEEEVDEFLRAEVLVDLYPIVKGAIRVGQPSYSLKMIEPFYMPHARAGQVVNAADSVVEYEEYCLARDHGDKQIASHKLQDIADYNRRDCESTLGLYQWLRGLASASHNDPDHATANAPRGDSEADPQEAGQAGKDVPEGKESASESKDPTVQALSQYANNHGEQGRTPRQTAVALVAAAVGFPAREEKPFWWGHYDRLLQPVELWSDTRDTIHIERVEVVKDWHKEGRQRNNRRHLRITGTIEPGCSLLRDKDFRLLYDDPLECMQNQANHRGIARATELRDVVTTAEGESTFTVTEMGGKGCDSYAEHPMAVAPGDPPRTNSIRDALSEVASKLAANLPSLLDGPGPALPGPVAELLLRQPPGLVGLAALPVPADGDFVGSITEAVLALNNSTLAVQGPPGTGKTYVGARVIAHLLQEGWKIGVVSQGHSVVNHLLDAVMALGVSPEQVGKKGKTDANQWTDLKPTGYSSFLAQEGGRLLGGTAWDFTHEGRVQRQELDLLVIDEAGQFSLAMTLAVSVSARRLLLLGDPQQLPQVSQGQHPEPVDESALGWLSDGQTLQPELGYFLDQTYRMSPPLTERVSRHSYEGRLRSKEALTTTRDMSDLNGGPVPAGLFSEAVEHQGNAVAAPAEAGRIVELVQEALTWQWQDNGATRPITQADVLVVAPYNAQIDLITAKLANIGLSRVRVGTVDKFQGQEAPVVFVSMTASAPEDVPRGMEFLLLPNRINVAISRAQWRATIVYSPNLTTYLPSKPEGLADLGGFLSLVKEP
ncbi:MAG: TM0106 family RecB-like putative nuclease [Actinomycetia bacterium]|nr:TM0106 family RecB-like putative nuclease [Actinomycetes bacterium]